MPASLPRIQALLVFFLLATATHSQTTQGPNPPSVFGEEVLGCLSCPGALWSDRTFIDVPDSQMAFVSLATFGSCFQSSCHYARALMPMNFTFLLSPFATITGIEVNVLRKASAANSIKDSLVELVYSGNIIGSNRADTSFWPAVRRYVTYGDSTDTWGNTLSPIQVNSSSFGLYYKPSNKNMLSAFMTAFVDHVTMTVYYTTPTGLHEHQTSNGFAVWQGEDYLEVHGTTNGAVTLFNSFGQKVFESGNTGKIETGILAAGVYYLQFKQGDRVIRRKVLID
jgi:hypothetical protein